MISKKWHQLSSVGAILLFVTLTSVSSNTFIDDLVRLSQIKNQLQIPILSKQLL